ncbi:hypothetical protein [Streptomyces kebangsaanensis]|uniref:hypothetical protein n=1 Tax=Streptomyces kebangsaanensis TaxID=864058 RepID=UPI000A8F8924|nr:hypothetical protein [Streptomyces kebangsaanensis]
MDATGFARPGAREPGPDWDALGSFVRAALEVLDRPDRNPPEGAVRVPLLDLLDDEADVAPGRYAISGGEPSRAELAASWRELATHLADLTGCAQYLAGLDLRPRTPQTTATVGDLVKADALTLLAGQQPPDGATSPGAAGLPLLTVPDLLQDGVPGGRAPEGTAHAVAEEGDVVVAGVIRAFRAWVHQGPPTALGTQPYALRVDPEKLDAHFLAGCLRAPANGRQAATHASSSSRVDIRRLQVLPLPPEEQTAYATAFRRLTDFEELLARAEGLGRRLMSDGLAAGGLGDG